jgi:NADP-dependent 3-hydroxy acid dehydrogenase YdfG
LARDPQRLEDLVVKYGNQVRAGTLDVADEEAAYAAVQVAVGGFGRLDVVVNNAGYGDVAPFEQLSAERFKAVMDTNFYGVVNVTRAALPIMRNQRSGCIMQISSVGGRLALPGSTAYHAAKWAVGGFTESLAQQVAPFGVKVWRWSPAGCEQTGAPARTRTCPTCSRTMNLRSAQS